MSRIARAARSMGRPGGFACTVVVSLLALIGMSASPAAGAPYSPIAWGENQFGELGDGNEIGGGPFEVSGLNEVAAVAAGGEAFSLALLDDGTLRAWGVDNEGQLGDGGLEKEGCGSPPRIRPVACGKVPIAVSGVAEAVGISAGGYHALAVLSDGSVDAWGSDVTGQLGNGSEGGFSDVPTAVKGITTATAVAADPSIEVGPTRADSMALLSDGTVLAWGDNTFGELGNGTTTNSDVPVEVHGLAEVVQISAGYHYNLALLKDGTVMAWGHNHHGQLGDGTTTDRHEPVAVSGLTGVVAISAGANHSLALLGNGTVEAWGTADRGDGGTGDNDVPAAVSGLSEVTAISSGGGSLARLSNGTVETWGVMAPAPLGELTGVVGVSAGALHDLAFGVPTPVVTNINPKDGRLEGATRVTITGLHFNGATAVDFGGHAATEVVVNSATSITATSPPGTGTQDVTVTTPEGTSGASMRDRFRYEDAPEYGRCVKVAKGVKGKYSTAKCTSPATLEKFGFEWIPGPGPNPKFTTNIKETTIAILETGKQPKVECIGEHGSGEYTGPRTMGNVVMQFTGCKAAGNACTSASAAEGEVVTQTLDGVLGWENRELKHVVNDLSAADGGMITEFVCGALKVSVRGSALVKVPAGSMLEKATLSYTLRPPTLIEGDERIRVLESSFAGGAYEVSALQLKTVEVNQEKIEVNWFV